MYNSIEFYLVQKVTDAIRAIPHPWQTGKDHTILSKLIGRRNGTQVSMSRKPNETVMSFLLSLTGAPKIGEDVVRTKYDAVTGPSGPLAAGKNLEIWGAT